MSTLGHPPGFTLIEIVVTAGIISLLSVLVVAAYPKSRSNQQLVMAERQIQSAARDALEMAINEERGFTCRNLNPPLSCHDFTNAGGNNYDLEKRCADIGLLLPAGGREAILLADVRDPAFNVSAGDCEIKRFPLPDGVTISKGSWYLFTSTPPASINEYFPVAPDGQAFSLKAGGLTRSWVISRYAQVSLK